MMSFRRQRACTRSLAVLVVLLVSCTEGRSTGNHGTHPVETTSIPVVAPIRVLVTNDDGVAAPGIDVLVRMLSKLPNIEVTVWAPSSNVSGTGDTRTPGGVAVGVAETLSGHPAHSVEGFPADAVLEALATDTNIALVVSGINAGANLGPSRLRSGTVGAARTAVRRGVWALAVSVGGADGRSAFAAVEPYVRQWFVEYEQKIRSHDRARLFSLNAPTCIRGELGQIVEVAPATDFTELVTRAVDCTGHDGVIPVNDVQAYEAGHPSLSELSATNLHWVNTGE